jgi:hypothetical protein
VELDNVVYLPKLGTSLPVATIEELKIKQQNYYQIILDSKIIRNEYFIQFFKSELGRMTYNYLLSGSFIRQINKSDLQNVLLPIPPLSEQNELTNTGTKIQLLMSRIEKFEKELALNPKSAELIQDKLDNMLESINVLSEEDRVRALLRSGESKIAEFKQTFSMCVRENKKAKYIEDEVLKNIAAFLNTDGGTILVGVDDNSNVVGVDVEITKYFKNEDGYLKHIKNLVKRSIGEDFYPLINYGFVRLDGIKILVFKCDSSDRPCYMNGNDFYVRTNPATDKLDGPKMVDYINSRFKKS